MDSGEGKQNEIRKSLSHALKKLGLDYEESIISLSYPADSRFGDYTSNVAFILSKKSGKKPLEIALEVEKVLNKDASLTELVEKVSVLAPGFINFTLSKSVIGTQFANLLKNPDSFSKNTIDGKLLAEALKKHSKDIKIDLNKIKFRFLLEFGHPNTHKEFHIGHLRNITTAESIVRLWENSGIEVVRANYQGDVGMHIAKCLFGTLQNQNLPAGRQGVKAKMQNVKTIEERVEFLGKVYVEGNKAYEDDESAKKEIIEINRKIYDKDPQILKLWKETRQWSLDYFEKMYKRVGSHYDRYYFESEVFETGRDIVNKFLQTGIFKRDKGAIIFPGENYGLHNRVFITGAGFPTYEAKDMGLGILQFEEYNPDLIVHIVGPEQAGYFQVIFKALEKVLPKSQGREYHYIYGWVQLKEGKMSSRKGNVVTARWLLDKAREKALEVMKAAKIQGRTLQEMEEVAEKVGVAAVKYSFLKFAAKSTISFDFDSAVTLEGDSGPYLLYTYARCRSVLAKIRNSCLPAGTAKSQAPRLPMPGTGGQANKFQFPKNIDINDEELSVLRVIYKFPQVTREAALAMSPNILCLYLYNLATKFNLFYTKHSILTPKEGEKARDFRLALTQGVASVLKRGLYLLGIETVEKM